MTTLVGPVTGAEPFQPRSPDYLRDPFPVLQEMRSEGSCWIDPGTGKWFLLGFSDVEAGLSRIVRGQPEGPDRHIHFPANPFAADGPGHTGPRRIITPTFTNRAVQQFRDRVQQIVDDVLDDKVDGSELRVIEEVGFTLPYLLTCEMLGVPTVDNSDELRDWTWKCLELIDAFLTDEQLRINLEAAANLAAHLDEVIAWKRDHLGDDVLSTIIAASDDGRLQPEQVVPYVHTLYLAGMHTTVNQTGLSLNAILDHRDQWELLCADPSLLENAVEELLRFEPTAHYFRRTGSADIEIGGVTIPAGVEVLCWVASANRDVQRWGPAVNELDITRADARQHVAFGKGPHACLGSWLARLELQVVIGAIAERFPNTVKPDQDLVWASNVIRGPEELLITLRR
ncbi:MAG: cytochrome P450 [Acidimicrobiales bacterium]|nr:cytochrome P450 [Acidimicrobiales bacterium]